MKLYFDTQNVKLTEFGVGLDDRSGQRFVGVPVDGGVQEALREMVDSTHHAMLANTTEPVRYEPSEKYSSVEHLYLPRDDDLATSLSDLYDAKQLDLDSQALSDPSIVFCYFACLTDNTKRRLLALRRAAQFKGVLKSRLIRLVTDALMLVHDRMFKLDSDFDLLVDPKNVHILRPSGFEAAGKLQQAILEAVPENVKALRQELTFVDLTGIEAYAGRHPRAARYLASIRVQKETRNIDKRALKKLCKRTGVAIRESNGAVSVVPGHELGFLEVLDRRRYELELVKGLPERFRAGSRSRLQ